LPSMYIHTVCTYISLFCFEFGRLLISGNSGSVLMNMVVVGCFDWGWKEGIWI
jgi:hypothetical protein